MTGPETHLLNMRSRWGNVSRMISCMAVNRLSSYLLLIAGLLTFCSPLVAQNSTTGSVLIKNDLVSGDPYKTERFYVDSAMELSIFTLSGDVEVYENPAIDYIQIDLYVDRGFSFWGGGANLDNYRIIFQKTRRQIIASVEPKRNESKVWEGENVSFSYIVQTPVDISSRIRNTRGDIYARNLKGDHLMQATVGNLYVENIEGEINAYSASGNINAERVRGNLNAKTTNGKIIVLDSDGEMRLRSVTGHIEANGGRGTFIAATTTGNVEADLLSVGEGSYVETVTGNIDMILPGQLNYSLEASGSTVDISDLLNSGDFEGNVQKQVANVVFGSGSIPVQLSSVTGKVTVKTSSN